MKRRDVALVRCGLAGAFMVLTAACSVSVDSAERAPVVLGQELADANQAEQEHDPGGPCPLAGRSYSSDEVDLDEFVDSVPLDYEITDLTTRFVKSEPSEQVWSNFVTDAPPTTMTHSLWDTTATRRSSYVRGACL